MEKQWVLDFDRKRSPLFEHTQPLSEEHSGDGITLVQTLDRKDLLSLVRSTCSRQGIKGILGNGALLQRAYLLKSTRLRMPIGARL